MGPEGTGLRSSAEGDYGMFGSEGLTECLVTDEGCLRSQKKRVSIGSRSSTMSANSPRKLKKKRKRQSTSSNIMTSKSFDKT